jgi:hypothetical protein
MVTSNVSHFRYSMWSVSVRNSRHLDGSNAVCSEVLCANGRCIDTIENGRLSGVMTCIPIFIVADQLLFALLMCLIEQK